jgi:outer membrane protein assembly factor BamB
MTALAIVLSLAVAATGEGLRTRLPPAPVALYRVAWHRPLVPVKLLELAPLELGGASADPASGLVVCGTRDGWLHALRPDGTIAWEFKAAGPFVAPPAIDGDTVYAGSADGRVYALAAATGEERWRYDAKEEMGTRPVVARGTVFVSSLQDTLFAIDARTGAWRWHHRREAKSGFTIRGAAGAAVVDGTVYAAYSDGFVAALDAGNGQVRWERQVAPPGDYLDVDGLRVEGNRLYAAAYSGAVLAVDAESGAPVWSFRAPTASRVAVGEGLVVAVTGDEVYGLSPLNGKVLWTTPLGGAPGAAPAFVGRWLLVPATQGGLRFLEAASGRTVRVFDPGTGVAGAPGVNGSRVYVLSNSGDLFALDVS